MPKTVRLLLTENVDSLGIVGDVVTVRNGYARNFLLPRNMATTPSEEALAAVAARRAEAQRQLAEVRRQREALVQRLQGAEISIQRSCNDLGHLYASVTQQDIATALEEAGFHGVRPRDVRLHQHIKRIDTYDVHIKFEADLEATIKLWVLSDRKLDLQKAEAPSSAEGAAEVPAPSPESVEAPAPAEPRKVVRSKTQAPEKDRASEKAQEKPAKSEPSEKKTEKAGKAGKGTKASEVEKPAAKSEGGWGKKVEVPMDIPFATARRGRRRS